jgi:branched-chain amino acid transport system substrate-binding protein
MKKRTLILTVLACVVLVAAGLLLLQPWERSPRAGTSAAPAAAPAARPLVVGALLPQTGAGAVFSEYIQKGIELGAKEANQGGVRAIEIAYADSKNDPKEGVSAFRQMVLTKSPPVMITALSSVTKAVAPLAKESNTVIVGTAVGLPGVTAPSDYVFRVYPEANGLAGVIANYAAPKFKTAAIVYIDDDFGVSGARVFEKLFQAKGGRVLAKEPYKVAEADFRNQWTRIQAAKPECVWITGYGPAYSMIVRQMHELGVPSVLLADMTLGLPVTLKNVGPAAEGVVYVDGLMDAEFVARYRAAYGDQPTSYAGYAYDIVGMLNELRSQGRITPQALRDGLSAMRDYPGAMGPITILDNRDANLRFILMRIVNGSPVQLAE